MFSDLWIFIGKRPFRAVDMVCPACLSSLVLITTGEASGIRTIDSRVVRTKRVIPLGLGRANQAPTDSLES